ncbi:MAG: bifunctional oligoribonuclease/PAP phosphatase NrnA [Lachnospiraceae bacterium]|nr:bifunctional oligoribonuclease/PAP phosphatase NrnA [Lachnospiraceae bacterium]
MQTLDLEKICCGAEKIGISGHIRPDGDCVGSCIALSLYLKKAVKGAEVTVFLEKPADIYNCLKGAEEISTKPDEAERFDVFFALDCSADRLGAAQKLFEQAGKRINIDHHISNEYGCGDENYVVPSASSTSELVYGLMKREYLDADIAKAVYLGIIHDTGVFQYSNTSPETMRIGAELIGYGFDFTKLIEETFYEKTYVQNQILGRALLESVMFMDGRCIVSVIEKKTMDFYGVTPQDLDGIVSQLRNTKGVDCAVFLYQTGILEYKVSLRSNEKVNVAEVAGYFGGGGHVRAAGCTMSGTYHDVINNLSRQIEKQFEKKD